MRSSRLVRWLLPALMFMLFVPSVSFAQIAISITVAPPELPVYEQPPCPEEGWMWSPGYWAYGDDGYYWVPGEWVPAPYVGALWTPPWWGWNDGRYLFHEGYWGNEVGYYGGIDYGFGYMGIGFVGGEWRDGSFAYNTAVMRVNTTIIHNTYVNQSVVRTNTIENARHVAFNGGPGGIRHDPTPAERTAMSIRHTPPTSMQTSHIQQARADRASYAKANGGHPRTLAVAKPAESPSSRNSTPPARGATRPGATRQGTESRAAPSRTESRPSTSRTESRSRTESAPRPESRSTSPRTETRTPAAERSRTEPRSAASSRTESRPAPEPKSRPRTATEPRAESHPAPRTESHPVAPRTESRPAESRPASRPPEHSRPAPTPRQESRPAPASHPAPQHETRPAPPPRQEKPKQEEPKPHL